ncbi:MAG: beta-N-acetylhexosaminidase [Solirubrobacteraceae bacterium]|jgi:beta-N-acetylhexosaminidase|nr:beta-N-acetylhexosaminidase [Solirubrobacteraceae bacterium]
MQSSFRGATVLAGALLCALVALAVSGSTGAAVAPGAGAPAPTLTLRQLVGQHMIFSYAGTSPPAALVARIARGEAAGVILFTRNIASRARLRATIGRLQAIPRPAGLRAPLLVMIDQEGGLVKRLSGAPRRAPAELGRIGSDDKAAGEGRATARNLRGVGVNVDLAPVLDVARPNSFQERTQRSYGRSPSLVSSLGLAFASGLRQGRVAATAKHFPGIGVPEVDEDSVASRISLSSSTLRAIDEAPFAAAAVAGIDMVMVSTAIYPAIDGRRPAMLSRRLTTDELRGRVGFRGVSITDDLETAAASRFGSPARRALLAARAGADLLLYAQSYERGARAADALVAAAAKGRVSREELARSIVRVLALRASL